MEGARDYRGSPLRNEYIPEQDNDMPSPPATPTVAKKRKRGTTVKTSLRAKTAGNNANKAAKMPVKAKNQKKPNERPIKKRKQNPAQSAKTLYDESHINIVQSTDGLKTEAAVRAHVQQQIDNSKQLVNRLQSQIKEMIAVRTKKLEDDIAELRAQTEGLYEKIETMESQIKEMVYVVEGFE